MTAEDVKWAAFIKRRDGYRCAYCRTWYGPNKRGLQAAHIFGRSIPATRCDPDNGVSLCYGHHRGWAHRHPLEFHEWVRTVYLGPERYDALRGRAKRPLTLDTRKGGE